MTDEKLLSFCMAGRNDNYHGNFQYRLGTAINYLARSAKTLGVLDQIEILVTDWNSESPLHECIELSPEAASISRFILVPPDIALKYHHQYEGQEFNTTCAFNTTIRRASGLHVVHLQADNLFPPASLLNFMKIMNGETRLPYDLSKCLLKISRRMISHQLWRTEPGIEELEAYLVNVSGKLPYCVESAPDIASGLGGLVASRRLWHLARGYDERISGWGHSDTEFGLRIEQVYPSQELSHYGVWLYDLHEDKSAVDTKRLRLNTPIYHNAIAANSVTWGLGDECLEMKQPSGGRQPYQVTKREKLQTRRRCHFEKRDELISNMASKEHHEFLRENLPFSRVFRMKWKVFYPLLWYGLAHRLDNYLEFGVSNMSGAPIAVLANSCVNLFIVSRWEDDGTQNSQLSPLDISAFLNAVNFKDGRCRFIEGDVNTALDRIDASLGGKEVFDLVLFQPALYEENALDLLKNVMDHLSSNGAVVIAGDSAGAFEGCWKAAKRMYPSYTFVSCFKNEVGIILKSEMKNENGEVSEAQEMEILRKAWRPVRKRMTAYILVHGFATIAGSFRKCLYEPAWRWPMLVFRYCNEYLRSRRNKQLHR